MFYITNQSCLPGSYQANTHINGLLNLQQSLSIALRRNILAFKTAKVTYEIEPANSDKQLSTPGTSTAEDKGPKKDQKIESPVIDNIKTVQESKENSNPIAFNNGSKYQKSDKNGMFCQKRRIARKPKEQESRIIDKSRDKKLKTIIDAKTDFPTFIATVPYLRKLSNRDIQLMKDELKIRTVSQWHLVDGEELRRRRFIKQML